METKTLIEIVAVALSIIGSCFAGFLWIDARHAHISDRYELELQLMDYDIKRDNSARVYYENKLDDGETLSPADKERLRSLERGLEEKYSRQRLLQEKLMNME